MSMLFYDRTSIFRLCGDIFLIGTILLVVDIAKNYTFQLKKIDSKTILSLIEGKNNGSYHI